MPSQAVNITVRYPPPSLRNETAIHPVSATRIALLETHLDLAGGKCGSNCLTKELPCEWRSPATFQGSKRLKVNGELLPLLVEHACASPKLRQELRELAETWHCDYHNRKDKFLDARVEHWLNSFPFRNQIAEAIVLPVAVADRKEKTKITVPGAALERALVSPPTTPPRGTMATTTKPHLASSSAGVDHMRSQTDGSTPALPSPPTTPDHRTPAERKNVTAVRELRERLGLDSGRCGSGKKNKPNEPCSCASAGKDDEIDELLATLTTQDLAPRDLEDLLDKVAEKWHCHHHAWRQYKLDRVARWVALFPVCDVPVATKVDDFKSSEGLRRLLGLRTWSCGSHLKKCETNPDPPTGPRCAAQSTPYRKGDKHKAVVKKMLESLAGLTPASSELESTLIQLARKWHCKSHQGNTYIKERAREWLTLFIGEIPTTATTTTITDAFGNARAETMKLLRPLSSKCPYKEGATSEQCGKPIAGRNMRTCDNLANEIARWIVVLDDSELEDLLERLDLLRRCAVHDKPDEVGVAKWLSHIRDDITSGMPLTAASSVESSSMPALQSLKELKQNIYSRSIPSGYDESPLQIVYQSDEPKDDDSIRQRIVNKRWEPLTKDEREDKWGYLYAFAVEESPRYVKIGYTSRPVTTRCMEWQTACDREVTIVYPLCSEDTVLIPYPRRAEALCHAALEDCRVWIDCGTCRVQHVEWFEVSGQVVANLIRAWMKWMAKDPYGKGRLRLMQ